MKKIEKYISDSSQDTYDLGLEIAASLSGGELIALYGDLGAGKTSLTQGIASGLGVKERVNSPTFTIIKVYKSNKGKIKHLCHIDAYRLQNSQDLINIGIDDYLYKPDIVTVIEWAEKIKDILPKDVIEIKIDYFKEKRKISIIKK